MNKYSNKIYIQVIILCFLSTALYAQESQPTKKESNELGEINAIEENIGETGEIKSPEEEKFSQFLKEIEFFTQEVDEYQKDISRIIKFQYKKKRREIQNRFKGVIKNLSEKERKRRSDAISRFEEFLKRYPNNARYTPDALFRLAELHFEKSNDEYLTALDEYDELLATTKDKTVEISEPKQDYRKTISLFEQLINKWPTYRNVDGAYYLKGYCLLEMGEEKSALNEFKSLVSQYPQSRFVPETWTRIGEYYFDYNDLPNAIAAYQTVVDKYSESSYYDKALYKLAWTYYRNDQYTDAISKFRKLIEYSDSKSKKTGKAGSDLRNEAIEYLAISLQEDDWDGDGNPDPDSGFSRVMSHIDGDKEYDVEILRALSDIFFDNAKFEETILTIKYLLNKFPKNEENPQLHAKMITAYERLRNFEEAFEERNILSKAYESNSDWRKANQNKPDVIDAAEELAEDALMQTATYHHSKAQEYRNKATAGDAEAEELAISSYNKAASAYQRYLDKFPKSENAYDLNFFYAECLYFSFKFQKASTQYIVVRDRKDNDKYKEVSAFSAILSYENYVKELIKDQKLESKNTLLDKILEKPEKVDVKDEGDMEVKVINSEPIPPEVETLIEIRKAYIKENLNSPDDTSRRPTIMYKIGEVYFEYKHLDEAREWFAQIALNYPQEKVAQYAIDNIINSYLELNDWKNAELVIEKYAKNLDPNVKKDLMVLKVGATFKGAEKLFNENKFDEAAKEYERLIKENPKNKYEDAALNNLAVAYESTRRFESAMKAYERLYLEHPKSEFSENALFRVGINAERFYDYDKAIKSHLKLVKDYSDSPNKAFSLSQAAILLEQNQKYRESASIFEKFVKMFPTHKDTPTFYSKASLNYKKLGDFSNEIRIHDEFYSKFGRDPKQNQLIIESLARIAEIYQEKGNVKKSKKYWKLVIDEFNRRGMPVGDFYAQYPARGTFELIEDEFNQYTSIKLRGSPKSQIKAIAEMLKTRDKLVGKYNQVIQYKSVEWTLATFYRLGQLFQYLASALYEAPIPDDFSEEEEESYRTQLEDIAMPVEDEAIKRFEFAFEKAKEYQVINKWTKKILSSLNKYKPSDYPLFKEEKRVFVEEQYSPVQFDYSYIESEKNKDNIKEKNEENAKDPSSIEENEEKNEDITTEIDEAK